MPMPRAWTPKAMVAAVLMAGPGVAPAHLVTSGLGPVYDGVLLAANLMLPPWGVGAIAAGYGALHGLVNGSALAAIGADWPELLGIVTTVCLLTLLISAAVVPLRVAWGHVMLRVIDSWVAAVGLLMLGWTLQSAA